MVPELFLLKYFHAEQHPSSLMRFGSASRCSLLKKHKGVSLAIETVVILIIAVVILGILSYFLVSGSMPGLEKIKIQQDAAALCGQYVQMDNDCSGDKISSFSQSKKLAEVCKKLEYSQCKSSLNAQCIKQCCSVVCSG